MEWLIAAGTFLLGIGVGFLITKYFITSNNSDSETQQTEMTEKQLLQQNASVHITESRKTLDKLQEQCAALNSQLNAYQAMLDKQQEPVDGEKLEYFGGEASVILRAQQGKEKAEKMVTDYQPLDYSNQSSGLFNDKKDDQPQN